MDYRVNPFSIGRERWKKWSKEGDGEVVIALIMRKREELWSLTGDAGEIV